MFLYKIVLIKQRVFFAKMLIYKIDFGQLKTFLLWILWEQS